MKKIFTLTLALLASLPYLCAQDAAEEIQYRRSSIYSLMVKHEQQKFADTIAVVFKDMPVPDKYNDHDLSVKVVSVEEKKHVNPQEIEEFLNQNGVASRLVAKWFNRDFTNGVCDVELIKSRGVYNASEQDKALAQQMERGTALLEDAGLELINNTFVIVNDIRYIDKGERSKLIGSIIRVAGAVAEAAGVSGMSDLADDLGDITESLKGFKVKIETHLYQLVWDETTENNFYETLYTEQPNADRCALMDKSRGKFQLKYIGSQESDGSTTSFLGIKEDEPRLMVRKACQRALDDNVANLQKNFDVFKVKVPLLTVEPYTAQIGKKEGITEKSRFEVLEVRVKNGRTEYKRVAELRPTKSNQIWDNRFMAVEEKAEGATLGYTTFKKISGGDIYPGMLIREIK